MRVNNKPVRYPTVRCRNEIRILIYIPVRCEGAKHVGGWGVLDHSENPHTHSFPELEANADVEDGKQGLSLVAFLTPQVSSFCFKDQQWQKVCVICCTIVCAAFANATDSTSTLGHKVQAKYVGRHGSQTVSFKRFLFCAYRLPLTSLIHRRFCPTAVRSQVNENHEYPAGFLAYSVGSMTCFDAHWYRFTCMPGWPIWSPSPKQQVAHAHGHTQSHELTVRKPTSPVSQNLRLKTRPALQRYTRV